MCRKQEEEKRGAPKKSGQPDGVITILIIILPYRLGCINYWTKITQVFLQPLLWDLLQTVRILGQLTEQPLPGPGLPATSTALLPLFRNQIPRRSFLIWLSLSSMPTAWFAGRGSIWPLWLPRWKLGTTSWTTHSQWQFPIQGGWYSNAA